MTWLAAQPELWDGKIAIILAHGAGQGMNSPFMRFFHQELSRRGFLSVTFNFDYMEHQRKVPDPQPKMQALYGRVIQEVISTHKPQFLFIGGKSMGGRVASYIAPDTAGVHGIVFLGYPLHPPGKPDQMRDAHLYKIKIPMLFVSGTRDNFAEPELLEPVVQRLGERASLVWTEGGDHSLRVRKSDTASLQAAADSIEDWINKIVR